MLVARDEQWQKQPYLVDQAQHRLRWSLNGQPQLVDQAQQLEMRCWGMRRALVLQSRLLDVLHQGEQGWGLACGRHIYMQCEAEECTEEGIREGGEESVMQ